MDVRCCTMMGLFGARWWWEAGFDLRGVCFSSRPTPPHSLHLYSLHSSARKTSSKLQVFPMYKKAFTLQKKTSISGGNSRKSRPEAFSSRNLLINLTGRLSQTPFRMRYLLLFLRLPLAPFFILSTFKATLMVLGRAGE